MAIFRLEAKVFSRAGRGRSVVAAAAYRNGGKLKDDSYGKTFDYGRRAKGIVQTAILAPANAPAWAQDSSQLWNRVEKSEKRVDAQLAREFVLAVPRELSAEDQFKAAVGWTEKELVSKGMVAEVTLHQPKNGKNPHVHILTTMRKLEGDRFSAKKSREWNDKTQLIHWRKSWCEAENAALEKAGHPERVDHRSLKDRGIDRIPEPKVGVAATAMKRRGVEKDPRAFQRLRAVKLWNQTRPIAQALAAEHFGLGGSLWNKSVSLAIHIRDFAAKSVRGIWQSLLHPNSQQPKSGPDLSR
jgi:ATP-dependent exoDNAse (exonuclease V) alpha subunit